MKKFAAAVLVLCSLVTTAAELKEIVLPKPDLKGGKPLMQCFAERKTLRRFDTAKLPDQIVSDILFAADGVTRADGRKTVPTEYIFTTAANTHWFPFVPGITEKFAEPSRFMPRLRWCWFLFLI